MSPPCGVRQTVECQFDGKINIICSNPPYSLLDKVLEKSIALKPRIISYIIGHISFTAKRMAYMEENGYFLQKVCYVQVRKWLGNSVIVVYELRSDKSEKALVEYNYDKVKYG